jgi:hypothetical protein
MYVLRIAHDVADYDAWKSMFDSDPLGRAASGVTGHRVACAADDANHVLIDLDFADGGAGEAFAERLRELWTRVDVMRNPTARVVEVVETVAY